jgi:hypothetical protein
LRFSWATSLFGVRQMAGIVSGSHNLAENCDSVAEAAAAELKGPSLSLYQIGKRFQEGFDQALPSPPLEPNGAGPVPQPLRPVDSVRLNTSSFVVLGEGLAAGMGDFSLCSDSQVYSFPAQMARQMGVAFSQRLIEPPGIGNPPGFAALPVIVPSPLQTSVVDRIPPERPNDLSVPGYTVADAVERRASQPLIDQGDAKQTIANLVLGLLDIAYGKTEELGTQLEYALDLQPTFALVVLGYTEALEAAIACSAQKLPSATAFEKDYSTIVQTLRQASAEVLALTIPDPFDTAYFATLEKAAATLKVEPESLIELWRLQPDDRITVKGLNEIAFQIFAGIINELPDGCVVPAELADEIGNGVQELNEAIRRVAESHGAGVYELGAFFHRPRENGAVAGRRAMTGDYLGGFYSLNGYYTGATGHALIANEILAELNQRFGASFAPVDLSSVMASDPVAQYKPAGGANWTSTALRQMANRPVQPAPKLPPPVRCAPRPSRPGPLQLPQGLEQLLPLNKALSYFGDGISAMNCRTPQTIQYGSGGNLLFGGLAMVDSHLSGNIRIKFSPPVNGCTKFQISYEGGFTGDDEVLETPQFFKMAFLNNRVDEIPGFVSSGVLNIATGDVDTSPGSLNIFAQYSSSALNALVALNPTFPRPPQAPLSFPGQYGSACVVFEQRSDGLLDFTFVGTTFVPLGNGIVWPLNFTGPSSEFATIPAHGTVMHPHLALSTRQTEPADEEEEIEIPVNTLQEYTLFAPVSSFGDIFSLDAPQLGGPATGRSRLLGRVQIQYGPRCGNTVPIAVSTTTAGGTLAPMDPTPLAQLFPGRLTPGPLGFYENLRFPLRTYSLNDLAIIDDPFDIATGAVDSRTGRVIHPVLHRGFINQDLIFALIRVEPCTPQNSFLFRGPAEFRKNHGGPPTYQYYGQVHIPYPPGFAFPDPNMSTGFPIGGVSALDPYLWLWALPEKCVADTLASGNGEAVSSRFEKFRYRYEIPSRPGKKKAIFEYENFSQNGKFRMHSLVWVGFADSNTGSPSERGYDTLSFTGFGVWSKDGIERVELVSVQVSTTTKVRYIGIQIGLGDVSNVNTPLAADVFPLRPPEPGGYQCCVGLPNQPRPSPPPTPPCPPPPPCGAVSNVQAIVPG